MQKTSIKHHIALLFVAFLYGSNFLAVKEITPSLILPFGFLIFRVGLAGLLFWLLGLFIKEKINWKIDGFRIAGCALFGVGINMLFFFKGLSITSPIHGSIIMTLTPILVAFLSIILLNERLNWLKVTGLILGLVGASIIIYQATKTTSNASLLGDIFILLNALSYGTYLVIAKPLVQKYHPLTLVKWFFLLGFFFLLPFGFQEAFQVSWELFQPFDWFSFLFVIFGVTVIAYITNIWAMKKVSPSTVGAYIYLQPVFASIIGVLWFDEILNLSTILGASLVFAGVGLIIKKGH